MSWLLGRGGDCLIVKSELDNDLFQVPCNDAIHLVRGVSESM